VPFGRFRREEICQCPEMKMSPSLGFSVDMQMTFLFGLIDAPTFVAGLFFRVWAVMFVYLASPV
jgi:hypothetical protein